MRWFLDMCIVLYYAGEGDRPDFNKKTRKFVERKKEDSFLLCYYIKEINLPKWLERQKIILKEIAKKLSDKSYTLYSSSESLKLTDRDKKKLIKLLVLSQNIANTEEKISKITRIFFELERRINYFLKNYIDETVVPVSDIDFKLKSCLFTWLALENPGNPNDSDAKTLASAIQEHNKKELKIITADKKDWNKELLEEVHNDIVLNKKYPKLPEIKHLQNL